jgi:D-alanyl-D-alanine carboxypeptidase/D-alanyl-D-alanine-endopeptidase (penicillin-binding protein 4)
MKTILKIPVLAVVLFSSSAWALNPKWVEHQKQKMEQILKKSGLAKSDVGILVAGGEGGPQTIFALNSDRKFIPASITKIVTAAATLHHFLPGTKMKTQMLSTAAQKGSALSGDLYLKGGGDPSFVSETMWYLVNVFSRTGIKTVDGDIVVDDTLFDALRTDQSRQKERVDHAYDAPVGAMSFNWNSVNVFIRPAAKAGEPASVILDPLNDYTRLKAEVKTVAAGKADKLQADREESASGDLLVVRGQIAVDSKEMVIYRNITQPDLWSGENLKAFLAERGITVKGKVRAGKTPTAARVLAEAEGHTIEEILADMDKFSNNYVAEMLTKGIAAQENPPGTIEKGMVVIREYLKSLGVSEKDFELQNPSGLTLKNLLTPQALWRVLDDMRSQFPYQPEFVSSLPIAGVDGTLKRRMKGTPAERWVRAKTGFLTGVVSLAGYVGRRDGTVLPFVFMYNGNKDAAKVRQVFDELATSLASSAD